MSINQHQSLSTSIHRYRLFAFLAFLLLCSFAFLLFFSSESHAATTGQVYPTLGTSVSESPWSDNGWTTPENIYAADAANANVTAATFDSPDQTYVLKATGFDFSSIPDDAVINGVTVRINAQYASTEGSGSVDLCQLLNTSRAKVGTNNCSTAVPLANTMTVITKGSASDKWGNSLTPAWVKDPDFGVAIGILATTANADVYVDYVTVEIDYSTFLTQVHYRWLNDDGPQITDAGGAIANVTSSFDVHMVSTSTIYVAYSSSTASGPVNFAKTTDGGATWSIVTADGSSEKAVSIFAADANTIFISSYDDDLQDMRVSYSTNGGVSWTAKIVDAAGSNTGFYNTLHAVGTSTVFVSYYRSGDQYFASSSNGGVTWGSPAFVAGAGTQDPSLFAVNLSTLYMVSASES